MRFPAALLFLAMLGAAPTVLAQPPRPLDDATLYAFPGASIHPASAALAGGALASRWLGEEPFDNPALFRGRALQVSPALVRMSRQDLRVDNRNFDESPAFIDLGGAWIAMPVGAIELALYGHEPRLRREDNAFVRGEVGGPVQPAVIASQTTSREWRGGLAAAFALRRLTLGVAAEWTSRDDEYLYTETSGSPDAGEKRIAFSGSGAGFQAGAHWRPSDREDARFEIGLALRMLPELEVDGEQRIDTPALDTTTVIAARRESGIEGGLSVRTRLGRGFHVIAGGGSATARDWAVSDPAAVSFAAAGSALTSWSLAGEFHDPEEPWRLRFGYGQERQDDAPEPRAALFGLSFGWTGSGLDGELGVMRRAIDRDGSPRSFDDRVVATLRFGL